MHQMLEMPWKKRKTAMLLARNVEDATAYTVLRTIVSQKHMYDKESEKKKLV